MDWRIYTKAARLRCEAPIFEKSLIGRLHSVGHLDYLHDDARENRDGLDPCFGIELVGWTMVVVGELGETSGSVAWQLSSLAADAGCGIRKRPRRASTRFRARSKFVNDARQGSRLVTPDANLSSTSDASQFVQLAGMSDRLPSGSTMSSSRAPPRLIVLITGNARPSNGCRSRIIVADRKMSWRWVVCDDFLR